jgi:predicted phosphodiesterase
MKNTVQWWITLLALAAAACSSGPARTGQLKVTAAASALGSGVAGVWVQLTNTSTNQAVEGWTTNDAGVWTTTFQAVPVGTYDVYAKAVDGSGAIQYETPKPYPGGPIVVTPSGSATLTLVLQQKTPAPPPANTAPYFVSLYTNQQTISSRSAVQLTATAADPDAGDALTFSWSAQADLGTFGAPTSTATTSSVAWTPPGTGAFVLTCRVQDSHGATASLSIAITVSDAATTGSVNVVNVQLNDFPAVQGIALSNGPARVGQPLLLTATASDANGDPLSFTWTVASCAGSFASQSDTSTTSAVSFTPSAEPAGGACLLTVKADDGKGGTGTATLGVTFQAGVTGAGPQFYVNASKLELGDGDRVELQVMPVDNAAHGTWSYGYSDGLAGQAAGAFTVKSDRVTDGSDRWYAPAACALLGSNDLRLAPAVTVTDSATGLSNTISVPVTLHCPAPWKFAVMSDTQWPNSPDGLNPNSVAVNVINHLNDRFVAAGVKFVVAVGDLTDNGSVLALDTRATFAQALYNAGIGFYPLRGNHESSATAAAEFQRLFPQTQGGLNDQPIPGFTPVTTPAYPAAPLDTGVPFTVGTSFQSFKNATYDYTGLFYSFDFANARFVLVDQFTPVNGASHANLDAAQVDWVGSVLAAKPVGSHGFVFSHKGLITENHADTLFGANPSSAAALQNTFMANLASNGVRYLMGGHDHMHNRALVVSPDGLSTVQDITAASDSYKFYIPASPSNDAKYDVPANGITNGPRETELAQELFTVGYYVFTVDGPRVTVEYFASPNGCSGDCDLTNDVIPYAFSRHETFGYGLNGKEFLVAQGASYDVVQDSRHGTTARILAGTNGSTETDYAARPLKKAIDTAWALPAPGTASAVLTLMGMTSVNSANTDTYALSLSYTGAHPTDGSFGLAVRRGGEWINAVDASAGAVKSFVAGPYQAGMPLGTYGIDPATRTVWAVVNVEGDFAAASFPWSFAVLCDSRSSYASDPAGTASPYYAVDGTSPYFANVARALGREQGIDLVLYPGDLVRGKKPTLTGAQLAADLDLWVASVKPVYDAGLPVYYVRGNHDAYEVSDPANGTAAAIFAAHVGQPGSGANPVGAPLTADTSAAGGVTSYSFSHKGSLFLGVDEYPSGAASPAAYDAAFVRAQLAQAASHKFAFAHQPLWNFKSDELGPVGLADDLQAGNVDLYFSGHVHSYQRIAESGYRFEEMIIGTAGAPQDDPTLVSGGAYTPDPRLTVKGYAGGAAANARLGYAVVTVHGDGSITTVMKFLDDPTSATSTVSTFDAADVTPIP